MGRAAVILIVPAAVLPAYAVSADAAVAALLVGSLAAWYETGVLLGRLPVARMLAGIGFGALFLAFAVALVALVAAVVRGVLATASVTLVTLHALAVLGNLGDIGRWLPTSLAGALAGLVRDTTPGQYLPATAVAVAVTAAALASAVVFGERCEI